MASGSDLLLDGFERVHGVVHSVVEGLGPADLTFRIDPEANTIAWLVWHLTRVQDDHVAGVAGSEQIWTTGGWAERFALPFPDSATGYGHGSEEVAAVTTGSDELLGYHDAAYERTVSFVSDLSDANLDAIVDESFEPPVTMAVRLVSVISDDLQHAGQAAFLKGILERTKDRRP